MNIESEIENLEEKIILLKDSALDYNKSIQIYQEGIETINKLEKELENIETDVTKLTNIPKIDIGEGTLISRLERVEKLQNMIDDSTPLSEGLSFYWESILLLRSIKNEMKKRRKVKIVN